MPYRRVFPSPEVYKGNGKSTQFEICTDYVNNLGEPVHVALANGFRFTLEPDTQDSNDFQTGVIVRVRITCDYKIKNAMQQLLKSKENYCGSIMESIGLIIENNGFQQSMADRNKWTLAYQYTLPRHLLVENRCVYANDANVLFSLLDPELIHPYSNLDLIQTSVSTVPEENNTVIGVRVVDNEDSVPRLYLRLGEEIISVDSVKDNRRKSGAYVKLSNNEGPMYIPFGEDLIKVGLYQTKQEATQFGDSLAEQRAKRELAHAENLLKESNIELQRLKMENDNEAYKYKREIMELEARLNKEKHEYELRTTQLDEEYKDKIRRIEAEEREHKAQLNRRALEQKDYYEERSHQRKDSSEWLKALPTLLVGLGGLFMALKSFK